MVASMKRFVLELTFLLITFERWIINQTEIELTSLRPAAILFLRLILFFTNVSSKSANL